MEYSERRDTVIESRQIMLSCHAIETLLSLDIIVYCRVVLDDLGRVYYSYGALAVSTA